MRILLSEQEKELLNAASIEVNSDREYTDDEALLLLEQIRDAEIAHSQFTDSQGKQLYFEYGDIADKVHRAIPEFEE